MKSIRLAPTNLRPMIQRRSADCYKGDFGHLLIVAGSRSMSGAAILTALGALYGGAGLVTVALPDSIRFAVQSRVPEALICTLPEDSEGRITENAIADIERYCKERHITTIAMGPGLGISEGVARVIRHILAAWSAPLVLDADGLNNITMKDLGKGKPLILTPHSGEMSRLKGMAVDELRRDRVRSAEHLAQDLRVVCLLKGYQTVISEGSLTYLNSTGNPAMATGGMGDVLTGLIGALCAQKLGLLEAACVGAYIHGLAGDLAASADRGLLASDVAAKIPQAFQKIGIHP